MSARGAIRIKISAIILGAACLYLLANGQVSLWDRDEPRYAQASRQMLQGGDWVVPRYLDSVRTAKPVFIYWCQSLSMKFMGDTAFAARIPSAVAMIACRSLSSGLKKPPTPTIRLENCARCASDTPNFALK